jgi:hypothetical protein
MRFQPRFAAVSDRELIRRVERLPESGSSQALGLRFAKPSGAAFLGECQNQEGRVEQRVRGHHGDIASPEMIDAAQR